MQTIDLASVTHVLDPSGWTAIQPGSLRRQLGTRWADSTPRPMFTYQATNGRTAYVLAEALLGVAGAVTDDASTTPDAYDHSIPEPAHVLGDGRRFGQPVGMM